MNIFIDTVMINFVARLLPNNLLTFAMIADQTRKDDEPTTNSTIRTFATPTKNDAIESTASKTKYQGTVQSSATKKYHETKHQTTKHERSVTFHPALVTVIHLRVSTSAEEKQQLYFSHQELLECREEEAKERERLKSVINGQQKYQKRRGQRGGGSVTRINFQISA